MTGTLASESALTAVGIGDRCLAAAGSDGGVAVRAVDLNRSFTLWVPILPGWLCFQWLERHDYL